MNVQVLKDNKTDVEANRECIIQTQHIELNASKTIDIDSKSEMRLKTIKNAECRVENRLTIHARQNIDLTVNKHNLQLQADGQGIHIRADKHVTFKSQSDCLFLEQGSTQIIASQSQGKQLTLKAAKITLKAAKIHIPLSQEGVI